MNCSPMKVCNGCEKMRIEPWARKLCAAKCYGRGLRGERGRVLALCAKGQYVQIEAPAWCEKRRELPQSALPTAPSQREPELKGDLNEFQKGGDVMRYENI